MINKEKMESQEDSNLSSAQSLGQSTPGTANSKYGEDQESVSLTRNRYIKKSDKYFGNKDRKWFSLRSGLYVAGFLFFLYLLKRAFFDGNQGKGIYYNSFSKTRNVVKTYTTPFLDIQFDNPTSYGDIGKPRVEKEDYIPKLQMTCHLYSKDHLNIIIRDADNIRYEVPHEYPFPFPRDVQHVLPEDSDFLLDFEFEPFNLVIKRKSTEETIFSLADRVVYTNYYLEVTFMMPTREVYGFGERISPLQFKDGTYSLFILDRVGKIDHGKAGFNAQGHQSMYLCKEQSGRYHVNLFKNIAAQEIVLKDRKLTWKTIGGVLDFHFFLGENPEDTLYKYHTYVGGWTLPAFWHMGYHQCKWWGYKNTSHFEYVLDHFDKADLPLDVLWSDLDIFEDDQNFNYNEKKFPPVETQQLFKRFNKRWITVIQAYVPTQKSNPAWKYEGDILDFSLRDGITNEPLVGWEFSGFVHFIDFLNPLAKNFWNEMLDYMNERMPIAGLWLDANELTDLMNKFEETMPIYFDGIERRKYYKLPFYPGGENLYKLHLVKLDAKHIGGIDEYNVRSLNSYYQSILTYDYLKGKDNIYFPFVLSRGNMFGSGQFSFHFVPDISSTWELMRTSLGPTMTYQIFGIPFIGADICGFIDEHRANAELCARWHQLSVFYTFARNHHAPYNDFDNHQEPYVYKGSIFDSIKRSMLLRYSMLKQYYTFFFTNPGKELRVGTVMRPLFFEFHDKSLPPYGSPVFEEQFMIADTMMGAPILYPGYTNLDIYFPACKWFDMRSGKEVPVQGGTLNLPVPIVDEVPHFLKAGKLFLKQDVRGIRSTEDLTNVFNITAGLPDFATKGGVKMAEAVGVILDVPNYSEEVVYYQCTLENCLMNITVNAAYDNKEFTVKVSSRSKSKERTESPVEISWIHLLGVSKDLKASGKIDLQGSNGIYEYTYDKSHQVLSILISPKLVLKGDSNFVLSIKI